MKKLFILTLLGLSVARVHAQAPALINYQGVARNSLGSVIADQKITLRLTIHESTAGGAVVYQETRTLRTNNFGLFTIAIGSTGADVVQGSFAGINWGSGGLKFLQVEIDPVGGSRFVDMGTSQLLSVPYALYAGAAAPNGKAGGDLSGIYPNPVLADQAITSLKIANRAVMLNHINASGAAPGQVLGFDGTRVAWFTPAINGVASGDLTGNYPSPSIAAGAVTSTKIKANAVTTNHIADSAITNAKIAYGIDYSKLTGAPAALPPSGSAGGDLTGTYPNPAIAAGVVTTTKLADGAVNTQKIQDGTITTVKVADAAVTTAKLADGSITDTKISSVSYNKITGAPTSLAPNGAAGGDLTGTYPNPTIATGVVTNTKLADNSVSTQKIQDGAVGPLKIADGAVLTSKVADGAVTTVKVADAAVTTTKIADGAVTDAKINTVSYSKVTGAPATLPPSGTAGGDLSGTYPNPVIANTAVTTAKIADNAVTDAKVATGISYSKLTGAPTSLPPSGVAAGDLTGTYPNPAIATGAVTNTKLADAAVSTQKIQDGAVTTTKLADGSVLTSKIGDGAITTVKVADGAVTTAKVSDGAITDAKITALAYSKLTGAPTALPPTGIAGGDLTGAYPNPAIATGVVTTTKLADNAVTTVKIADGSVTDAKISAVAYSKITGAPVSLAPSGNAGGDLSGTYPNPSIAAGVVTTTKIADAAVTDAKVATGIAYSKLTGAPTSLPPNGAAGGDLTGTYPNPTIATGAVTNTKLADNSVSTAKIQDGAITASKLDPSITFGSGGSPTGSAGGDLSGNYPNPSIASGAVTNSKIANGAVVTPKIADGAVTSAKISPTGATTGQVLTYNGTAVTWSSPAGGAPTGTAGGDLTGTYPNPTIATGVVTTTKIADAAITDAKVAAGISYSKLSGAPASLPPSGVAGGDLTGTYPNPTIVDNAVTTTKISNGAVTTAKINTTGATTGQVLTYNGTDAVWNTVSVTGTAGGDLSGTYPNPAVKKLQGVGVSATAPATGQVLKYDGTQWSPAADNSFALPYTNTLTMTTPLFALTNPGTGTALEGTNSNTATGATAVLGRISSTAPGVDAAAVKGLNNGTNGNGAGVRGEHAGSGIGVYGSSQDGQGVFGTSNTYYAGYFDISNPGSYGDAIYGSTNGYGNGVTAMSAYGNGATGVAMDVAGAGVAGYHFGSGEGVLGYTASEVASGVVGRNDGNYAGVKGLNYGPNGIGVLAQAQLGGTAIIANIGDEGAPVTGTGNVAVFQVNGVNVARIDNTGMGYFNGGTQLGGADVAEFFDITGTVSSYEAGDVLVIAADKDRTVEKSATPYSTLVAGVYATKPGVLLTEKNAEQNNLNNMVPMGVIGVIPTKVCLEGGAIKRGDMLVTSSTPGVAMKADLDKVKVGQVLGKALQDYSGAGIGKINVLVSVK